MVTAKLNQAKKAKERVDEIFNSIEHLEPSQVKNLKVLLGQYMVNPDEESIKQPMDSELVKLLDIAETNKKIYQSNL